MGKRIKVIGYSYGVGTTVNGLQTNYKCRGIEELPTIVTQGESLNIENPYIIRKVEA